MENNIIVVQNVFEDFDLTNQSILSMRKAAHRWNCDFYELSYFKYPYSLEKIFWDRSWVYKNFINYDKVLILDPDIVINSTAPNIFNELTDEYDLAVALDGNPGNRFRDPLQLKNTIVKHIAHVNDSIKIFENYIPNFDYKKYWDGYFNNGVVLFNPKKLLKITQNIEQAILNNKFISQYMSTEASFKMQNIFNAFVSSSDLKIKHLDNNWNWILPDIGGLDGHLLDQWDPNTGELIQWEIDGVLPNYTDNFYKGKMHPYIYHFCGTQNAKNLLKTYNRWQ